jgi:clan AA aspartic protease
MGHIYADIELINSGDLELSRRHFIGEEEVKRITVNSMVDTGAYNLCINENVQEYLQLPFIEKRKVLLANNQREEYDVVGPVEIKFGNRGTSCRALVLSGDSMVLLGSIPLEDMDVVLYPLLEKMMPNPDNPDGPVMMVKRIDPAHAGENEKLKMKNQLIQDKKLDLIQWIIGLKDEAIINQLCVLKNKIEKQKAILENK